MKKKDAAFLIIMLAVGLFGIYSWINSAEDSPYEGLFRKDDAWADVLDSALEPVDCPVIERELDDSYYKGPLIDTHIHIPAIPDTPLARYKAGDSEYPVLGVDTKIADFVCMMDYEGTAKVFAFFPVWEPITGQLLEVAKKTMEIYPDRFVPFLMPPESDNSPGGFPTVDSVDLENMVTAYPGLFMGYGEIGLYEREGGAADLPPDSERLLEIYPIIRRNNMLVYLHLGEGHKESFERVLEENPDIDFIFHGDQLIPYPDGKQDLGQIDDILTNHRNAYYGIDELYGDTWLLRPDVTKEEFLRHFEDYTPLLKADLETWGWFIEKHADQVIWGTDRGWSSVWSIELDVAIVLNDYTRAFIARLDPDVQEKFAYKNAEKLLSKKQVKKP